MEFHIERPDAAIRPALQEKIDNLTKPKGSLGRLEELALQIGLIQQTLSPALRHPQNIVFAADHGIVEEGVSIAPKEVTWQQVCHFTHPQGTGGVNFLCRQQIGLQVFGNAATVERRHFQLRDSSSIL